MICRILPPRARAARCGGSVLFVMSARPATTPCNAPGDESNSCSSALTPSFARKPCFTATIKSVLSMEGATPTVRFAVCAAAEAVQSIANRTIDLRMNPSSKMGSEMLHVQPDDHGAFADDLALRD